MINFVNICVNTKKNYISYMNLDVLTIIICLESKDLLLASQWLSRKWVSSDCTTDSGVSLVRPHSDSAEEITPNRQGYISTHILRYRIMHFYKYK